MPTTKGRTKTTPAKRPKTTPRAKKTKRAPDSDARSTPRAGAIGYRDRVVGLVRVAPDRLLDHPENWRVHPEAQRDFLRAVLGDIGIAGAAVAIIGDEEARRACVKLATFEGRTAWLPTYEGPFMLIDGHLRKATIEQPIPTVIVDLSPEEARKALATHDTVTGMAESDIDRLRELVDGSSFQGDELARLRELTTPRATKAPTSAEVVDVSDLKVEFYLTVRGPVPSQPGAIERLRASLKELPGVIVAVGLG